LEYSVVTTSDKSYYPHLKILVNSILDKCDFKYLKNIYIIDNGLTEYQKDYFLDKSDIIKINTELFIETELPNIKYTGKWLVAYIHHIILRGSHLMELGLVRDSNVIEPSGNYFDGINFKYQQ